jgi:crotonobetainyl-CoA:carnitine CoA-transferase CaiB-like acyl-CoA transferase
MTEPTLPGALEGVRVAEFAQAMAIPAAGLLLADMGADVIKIEPPAGDAFRHTMEPIVPGEAKGYALLNRGKRSICLDVTRPEARPAIDAIARWADIVLMSFKPTDLPRYGIAYEDFRAINPRIVYLEHVPVGNNGPMGGDPGYDVIVQGMSGIAAIAARTGGTAPINIRPAFNDMGTGYLSALAVVAALRHRDLTGVGQRVETSLLATALTSANQLVSWFAATDPPRKEAFEQEVGEARVWGAGFDDQRAIWEKHFLRGGFANIYFRHYRTRDGFISVGCLSPTLNARFRQVTGLSDPRTEPGFDLGSPESLKRLQYLVDEAEALLATKPTAEWIDLFRAAKVPCGKFNFPPDVFDDPQINANEYIVDLDHPVMGPYKTFAPPIRMDATPTRIQGPPPLLDEHTDQVLAELGLEAGSIASLREAGVAGRSATEGA